VGAGHLADRPGSPEAARVVNGDNDTMWHTATGTLRLAHGGIFQYYAVFVQQALDFLRN
jgi:hypothetical protein